MTGPSIIPTGSRGDLSMMTALPTRRFARTLAGSSRQRSSSGSAATSQMNWSRSVMSRLARSSSTSVSGGGRSGSGWTPDGRAGWCGRISRFTGWGTQGDRGGNHGSFGSKENTARCGADGLGGTAYPGEDDSRSGGRGAGTAGGAGDRARSGGPGAAVPVRRRAAERAALVHAGRRAERRRGLPGRGAPGAGRGDRLDGRAGRARGVRADADHGVRGRDRAPARAVLPGAGGGRPPQAGRGSGHARLGRDRRVALVDAGGAGRHVRGDLARGARGPDQGGT